MALQEELNVQGDFLFRNRSYLPLIILAIGLWVNIHGEIYETESEGEWVIEEFEYICLGISLVGLLIRVITVGYSPKNTSGRNTSKGQIADALNKTGMYSIIRHPLYFGNFFIWLGIALITENMWFVLVFILMFWFYYERIMYAEETFLRAKFGDTYLIWAAKTPAIIPRLNFFRKSRQRFSWIKVLKNEKNAFTGIFVLFWLFEFTEEIAENGELIVVYDFWFYSAIISVLLYFNLRVLKRSGFLEDM